MTSVSGPAWYETDRFRRWVIVGFSLIVVAKAIVAIFLKENDFTWHYWFGASALNGTPYLHDGALFGMHYAPARMLINAPFALFPLTVARAICFALAIAALVAIARIWGRLADAVSPVSRGVHFAAAALAFVLIARWVLRDLDDCGLQIFLLFFLSMAAWSLWRGARIATGLWLALAISYKATPIFFVPFLIWKRRWLEAGVTVAMVIVFNAVVPAVVWGPTAAREAIVRHVDAMQRLAAIQNPAENGIEPPVHRNQSLPFAIARYLQTFPPGHPLFISNQGGDGECDPQRLAECRPHPLFVQFLDLSPELAKRIIFVVLLVAALALAWRTRRPWRLGAHDGDKDRLSALAPEWAVMCALAALLSPFTWLHHLTLLLPCAYLVIRDALVSPSRWSRIALLVVFVCVWIVVRDPLPRQLSIVAMSYHDDTLAALILMGMTLRLGGGTDRSASVAGAARTG